MGIGAYLKGSKAMKLQKKGEKEEAVRLYEEAFAEGLNDPRFLMPYALLIIRDGQYQKAKEFLVAHQKAPLTPSQRVELMVYYATCCFRLGNVDKGVDTLEQQFRKTETGLIYQTLGYLYVEQLDQARDPGIDYAKALAMDDAGGTSGTVPPVPDKAVTEEGQSPCSGDESTEDAAEGNEVSGTAGTGPSVPAEHVTEEGQSPCSPEEKWNAGRKKAEAFIRKSLDYDDEDPICLDNMGQFVYRVLGDKAGAKEWFDKAYALKPGQIDTLWFLSRYDLEAGKSADALEKLESAAEGRFSPLNYCNKDSVTAEIARLKGEA